MSSSGIWTNARQPTAAADKGTIMTLRTLSLTALLVGCNAPATTPDMANDFPPPAQGIQLKTTPYTVDASVEKYFCFTQTVTVDTAAIEVQVKNGALVHHLGIFQTIAPEPDGFSECPSLIKQTWLPLYGGGRSTPGMKLPAGAGFKFTAGTQILMQLHLVNASPASVTETTAVNLIFSDNPAALTPAGIFAVGNSTFNLPVGATGYPVVGKCAAPKALDVFAMFPHMHRLGRSIAFEQGASEATAASRLTVDPWSFGDQPMKMTSYRINAGDFLRTTCVYDNTDGKPVTYGESSYDEMCFMVLFYTPFDRLGGCIN
jgi:hypothetical protein